MTDAKQALANIQARRQTPSRDLVAETMQVAFGIDDSYTVHCATAMASLLDFIHPEQSINLFVLHSNLSPASQDRLSGLTSGYPGAKVIFVYVDADYFKSFSHKTSYISTATYFRLKLHELLPADARKALYIDSDLVVTDNIADLWNIDLGQSCLAAVPDAQNKSHARRLGLPAGQTYINAGVSAFNLEKIRTMDVDTLYRDVHDQHYDKITLQDQDILNLAFADSTLLLPARYNAQAPLFYPPDFYNPADHSPWPPEARTDPAIVHFTGKSKPWQSACLHPLKSEYLHYRKKIGWPLDWWDFYKSSFFSVDHDGAMLVLHLCFLNLCLPKKYVRSLLNFAKRLQGKA